MICPVGADDKFQQKRRVLEELGARHKIAPFFPLEQHTSFSVSVVKEDIRRAHFVLADLTKERPSCYFELGLAEALSPETIVIAELGTSIHQVPDVTKVRFYSDIGQYTAVVDDILRTRR